MFENNRRLPPPSASMSSSRSDLSTPVNPPAPGTQSNLPTEPWQVTRQHLNLTKEEMVTLGGEQTCSPEEMNAKVLKVGCNIILFCAI